MSSRYVGPKLPGKAGIVQKAMNFVIKTIPRKKKVSPDITKVKKFTEKRADEFAGVKSKNPQERANVIRRRESIKRMDKLVGLQTKRKEGIKAGKEVKKMIDTGQAKTVGGTVFHKGIREKKMGGGMMGRRFGMKKGTNPFKKETNVDKIKKTFAPKSGLKKIDPQKQKGLAKLKKARPDVVRKMGYMKKGGRAGFKGGGADMTNVASGETKREAKKFEKRAKAASKDVKNIGRSFTSIMNEKYRP